MKKILSLLIATALLLSAISFQITAVGDTGVLSIGSASAKPGDTIQVPVTVENNPGVIAIYIQISYDKNVLTLQDCKEENLFSGSVPTPSPSFASNPYVLTYVDATTSDNHTENGTLVTLTFKVNEDAPAGDTNIAISYSQKSTFNVDLESTTFTTKNGKVTVEPQEQGGWSFTADSTLFILDGIDTDKQFVTGLDWQDPFVSDYLETTGGWTAEVIPNSMGSESTGAILEISDENGDVVESYEIIFFGDLNGDGEIGLPDISLCLYAVNVNTKIPWVNYESAEDFPQSMAGDINHDGYVDLYDIPFILRSFNNSGYINQLWEKEGDNIFYSFR